MTVRVAEPRIQTRRNPRASPSPVASPPPATVATDGTNELQLAEKVKS